MKFTKLVKSPILIWLICGLSGITGIATGAVLFNTPNTGYLLCVNSVSKSVTYPGTQKCPKGSTPLVLGAQGPQGIPGPQGLQGLQGLQGPQGIQGITGTQTVVTQSSTQKVFDSNGTLMGILVGSTSDQVTVQVGVSRVTYFNTGKIYLTGEVYYLDNTCTGTKYVESGPGGVATFTDLTPLIAADAWNNLTFPNFTIGKATGPIVTPPTTVYRIVSTGALGGPTACRAYDWSATAIYPDDVLNQLGPVSATFPSSYTPPFSIRSN